MLKSAIRLALLRSDSTIAPLEAAKLGGMPDAYKKYFKYFFFFYFIQKKMTYVKRNTTGKMWL